MAQVLGRAQRRRHGDDLRAAHWEDRLGQEAHRLDVGPVAVAVANVEVHHALGEGIVLKVAREDAHIDFGEALRVAVQAWHQPVVAEGVERLDGKYALALGVDRGGGFADDVESGAYARQIVPAGLGQHEAVAAPEAVEQRVAPSHSSSALIWWLTAACVTCSESAARVKLRWRAAVSKTTRAFSGGKRRAIRKILAAGVPPRAQRRGDAARSATGVKSS